MINLAKKIFFYIKNEGLIYTAKVIFRFIANPVLYKIRPKLMEIQKQKFVKKYNISFPESDIFLTPDYLDLNNLVNQINNHRPKCILELGTGYSTYAMIFALNKLEEETGHKFEFYAVDQNEWYLNKLKSFIPEHLSKKINFVYRPLYVENYQDTLMSFFKDLPDKKYDFIYEDRNDLKHTKLAGDALKYENTLDVSKHKLHITIDGMPITTNYYKKNLKDKYSISGSVIHGTNFNPSNKI